MEKEKINQIIGSAFIGKELFGVDPGISGAIAKYNGHVEVQNIRDISTFEQLVEFWKAQKEHCEKPLVFLEQITTYTSDSSNVGRMFQLQKMKTHYAELRCSIKINKIPFIEVMPLHWMRYIGAFIPGEARSIRKTRFKDIAKDLFPDVKVNLNNADALLLVEFGLKKMKYDHLWIRKFIKEY